MKIKNHHQNEPEEENTNVNSFSTNQTPGGGLKVFKPDIAARAIKKFEAEKKGKTAIPETNKFPELIPLLKNEMNRQREISGVHYVTDLTPDTEMVLRKNHRNIFIHLAGTMVILLVLTVTNLQLGNIEAPPALTQTTKPAVLKQVYQANELPQLSEENSLIPSKENPVPQYILKKSDKPFEPLPFESFKAAIVNGTARFKWQDSEQHNPVTYMLQKSGDGKNFEIINVFDNSSSKETSVFLYSSNEDSNFYRLVKIVHGGNVYHSRVFGNQPNQVAVSEPEYFDLDFSPVENPS